VVLASGKRLVGRLVAPARPWDCGLSSISNRGEQMTFLWIVLAIVYIACWIYFGLTTFRKGHFWLFWIGFLIPILWIVGAFIAPTQRAAARAA
jgi:hypothetical protein